MKYITLEQYENIVSKNGVFVFTDVGGCQLCTRFLKDMQKYNTKDWFVIQIPHSETPNVADKYNLRGFPTTHFYLNNKIKWKKAGALFNVQIRDLNKTIKEYEGQQCSTIFRKDEVPELDYKSAMKKPIPVKCIQMDEAFQVETMEGLMDGKAGDWLMIGINGEMYPCDKEIFEKTYDLI